MKSMRAKALHHEIIHETAGEVKDTPVLSARGRLIEPSGPRSRLILSERVERGKPTSLRTVDVNGHAFMRAHPGELNVSWDRVDDQSQIDPSVAMAFADRRRGEELRVARPGVEHFVAQRRARLADARFQHPFPYRELARPCAEFVWTTKLMDRRFDQGPAQPRRPGLGDPPAPLPTATALDPGHQPA